MAFDSHGAGKYGPEFLMSFAWLYINALLRECRQVDPTLPAVPLFLNHEVHPLPTATSPCAPPERGWKWAARDAAMSIRPPSSGTWSATSPGRPGKTANPRRSNNEVS